MAQDTKPGAPARSPFSDADRLGFYRYLDQVYQAERRLGTDIVDVVSLRALAIGKMENRPHDISSLAAGLGLPRQTVGRRIKRLAERGSVVAEKKGNRTVLVTSPRARARSLRYTDRAIAEAVEFVRGLGDDCPK